MPSRPITLLLLLTTLYSLSAQAPKQLYPMVNNGLWGCINAAGKVVIQPQFHALGEFSEGLAPARREGIYGYIDATGAFVIPPAYDAAGAFEQGQAKVFIGDKPYFIDQKGTIAFEHDFAAMDEFGAYDCSIVYSKSGNCGLINRQGELLLDTIFYEITPFSYGVAIVTERHAAPQEGRKRMRYISKEGVIDTKGKFIIPLGKYEDIGKFRNGFASVSWKEDHQKGSHDHTGIVDHTGQLKFLVPPKQWQLDYNSFSDGLAIVTLYTIDPDTLQSWRDLPKYTYAGVINTAGELVLENEDWKVITPFKYNRAFVQNKAKEWFLIDRQGQILNSTPYQDILYDLDYMSVEDVFQEGLQFVKTEAGWGGIDTTGQFVVPPRIIEFEYRDLYQRGHLIVMEQDISMGNDCYFSRYGFWNTQNGTVVLPQFHDIQFNGFSAPLVPVLEDGRRGYINHQGQYIWRERKKQKYGKFNTDQMNRGYFYAAVPYHENMAYFGGWGGSGNFFQAIAESPSFEPEKLQITVVPHPKVKYKAAYKGLNLYLANTTTDTFYFGAQDSRLYLKIQAKDPKGQWRDIEYLPSSWCGNSYHTLYLPPAHYWSFVIPQYEGAFQTKLRAQLQYRPKEQQKEAAVLYSHEFEGSVNPGQFWKRGTYYSSGLMDPYDD